MSDIIACCGLVCSECPSYIATQNDDDNAREKTAAYYAEKFGFNLKAEDINCDGCLSDNGRLLEYCKNCKIRKCCREKGLINCAVCGEQPCEKIKEFHEFSPGVKPLFDVLVKKYRSK
jgi:hypothetical protein